MIIWLGWKLLKAHLQLGALLPLNPGERGDLAVGRGLVTTQTLLSPLLEKPVGKT